MVSDERTVELKLEPGMLRQLLRLVLESVVAGALASLVLGLAVFIVATQARAATAPGADVRQGTLPLRGDAGKAAAPLLCTARATYEQAKREGRKALPGNLPEGLSYDAIFGGLPQTATAAELELIVGTLLLASALLGCAKVRRRERAPPHVLRNLQAAVRATRRTC